MAFFYALRSVNRCCSRAKEIRSPLRRSRYAAACELGNRSDGGGGVRSPELMPAKAFFTRAQLFIFQKIQQFFCSDRFYPWRVQIYRVQGMFDCEMAGG